MLAEGADALTDVTQRMVELSLRTEEHL